MKKAVCYESFDDIQEQILAAHWLRTGQYIAS